MATALRLLIVAGEAEADCILQPLESEYDVTFRRAETVPRLLDALREQRWDVVVSGHHPPEIDGLRALESVQGADPNCATVLVMSPASYPEEAARAIRRGAAAVVPPECEQLVVSCVARELRRQAENASHLALKSELQEKSRLAELASSITLALIQGDDLRALAQRCTEVLVHYVGAAFARIWTVDNSRTMLELQASAGMYTHIDGKHARVPIGAYKIGRIAQERKPHLTNSVQGDPRVGDPDWAEREGMISFAGHPLIVEGELIGVMALFARKPLGESTLHALGAIADTVALGIKRRRTENALRERDEQLRQSQKMEAVGRLAGGVAHDFNNLLTIILGNASLVLDGLQPSDPIYPDLDAVRKASERAAGLVRQLLAFSRKQLLEPRLLKVNELVTNLQSMLRRTIGEDIDFQTRLTDGSTHVKADPGQIEQVVLNLIINARDAMPRGGQLVLQTSNVVLKEALGSHNLRVSAGRYVGISVSDTGRGMDPDTMSRIFEPFYTTKEVGKGTGLGLSTVHGIVGQSGGAIQVESTPGHGTKFLVLLPEEVASDRKDTVASERRPPSGGKETILVLEDEDSVREFVGRVLARLGYTIIAASCGSEALEICRSHDGPIHLILSDVILPQMSGPDFVAQASPLRPECRVLYMSGYTDDALGPHGVLQPGVSLMGKPFTPESIGQRVRQMLDGPCPDASPARP